MRYLLEQARNQEVERSDEMSNKEEVVLRKEVTKKR